MGDQKQTPVCTCLFACACLKVWAARFEFGTFRLPLHAGFVCLRMAEIKSMHTKFKFGWMCRVGQYSAVQSQKSGAGLKEQSQLDRGSFVAYGPKSSRVHDCHPS